MIKQHKLNRAAYDDDDWMKNTKRWALLMRLNKASALSFRLEDVIAEVSKLAQTSKVRAGGVQPHKKAS